MLNAHAINYVINLKLLVEELIDAPGTDIKQ